MLFELLTGRQPFTGDTPLAVAYQHVNSDVPAPSSLVPGIPAAVDQLVLAATSRDPALRPADAGEFARAAAAGSGRAFRPAERAHRRADRRHASRRPAAWARRPVGSAWTRRPPAGRSAAARLATARRATAPPCGAGRHGGSRGPGRPSAGGTGRAPADGGSHTLVVHREEGGGTGRPGAVPAALAVQPAAGDRRAGRGARHRARARRLVAHLRPVRIDPGRGRRFGEPGTAALTG